MNRLGTGSSNGKKRLQFETVTFFLNRLELLRCRSYTNIGVSGRFRTSWKKKLYFVMGTNYVDDCSTSICLLSEIAKTINRQSRRLSNSVALYNYHQKIARPDQKVLEITVGGLADAGALSDLQG